MTTIRRRGAMLLIGAAAAVLTGCPRSATDPQDDGAPEADARMSATITDGGSVGSALRAAAGPLATATLDGNLTGKAQVAVYREPGGWMSLGEPVTVSFPLQGGVSATIATDVAVPSGTYTQVRLILDDLTANVDNGSVVEDVTLLSAVSLTVGGRDGHLPIQKTFSTPITIEGDGSGEVSFDLVSGAWVTERAVQDLFVQDEAVDAAVVVTARAN